MEVNQLNKSMLFKNMTDAQIDDVIRTLKGRVIHYKKGNTIFYAGEFIDRLGLVLQGSVTIENNDMWGNKTILSNISKGQFFGETYALLHEELMVDVVASKDCQLLMLNVSHLNNIDSSFNPWVKQLLNNLLEISLHKNLTLSHRSFHTSSKTIRGRVMSYLNAVSLHCHQNEFDIPFDRQQMADYLNLERSALSKELSKMQQEGLIKFHKNHFTLYR